MNIVIRTDASIEIGTGHVMRCLTLARQLENHGAQVIFICRDFYGNSISYLKSQGIPVVVLPYFQMEMNDVDWTATHWEQDAKETINIMSQMEEKVDLVIVDHYGLDHQWESQVRKMSNHLMVIDDLANRIHDCDFLLDQNYYLNMNERYKGLVPEDCILMLGPDYVLLREEFLEAAKKPRNRTRQVNNLLVFFGGTDPSGETLKTLQAIQELDQKDIVVNVVVGASNPQKTKIEQICKGTYNTKFHCQVNNMAELMWQADLAIGAGGATTWERCLLGLPSMVVVIAENQRELTQILSDEGLIIHLGDNSSTELEGIKRCLSRLVSDDSEKLSRIAISCRKLINIDKVITRPVLTTIRELFG